MALSMRSRSREPLSAVQMPLCAQILFHCEGLVQALRLEHDAHRTPHRGRIARHIVAGDFGAPFGGHHHRGENAEERRLAAAIRPQQSKDLALSYFEADCREGNAVPVAVSEVLNRDHNPGLSRSIRP